MERLPEKEGYEFFFIVGVKQRKLGSDRLGEFDGYAKAEPNNKHDSSAVAIYSYDDTLLGYVQSTGYGGEEYSVHSKLVGLSGYLQSHGGESPCYGSIYDLTMSKGGKAMIYYNQNWKLDEMPREEKVYKGANSTIGDIELCDEKKYNSFEKKFIGTAKLLTYDNSNRDKCTLQIFNENNSLIGIVYVGEYYYNTIEFSHKENTATVFGYVKTDRGKSYGKAFIPVKWGVKKIQSRKELFETKELFELNTLDFLK
ncbi:hypothetical protein Barb7_01356 [Bacteroidales bacterium Barb7]|nr:hypothetical protein Barb7_01356 [Bacteroidales bacterium Barb7]